MKIISLLFISFILTSMKTRSDDPVEHFILVSPDALDLISVFDELRSRECYPFVLKKINLSKNKDEEQSLDGLGISARHYSVYFVQINELPLSMIKEKNISVFITPRKCD